MSCPASRTLGAKRAFNSHRQPAPANQGGRLKLAVIGAGVVGVTTAYELAAQGHDVTVFDKRGSVAEEASFANAVVISPAYAGSWASPGTAWRVIRQLGVANSPVRFGGLNAMAQLPWMWRWWRACRPRVHATNRRALITLAQYSRARMLEIAHALSLEFEQSEGLTVLLRSPRDLKSALSGLTVLHDMGVVHEVLNADQCRAVEPGLNPSAPLHAAIHFSQEGAANCRQFTHLLRGHAQGLGAQFRFETEVTELRAQTRPSIVLRTGETESFDALVICAGAQANKLLKGIGMTLPIAPVYGYSVTAPLRHIDGLPPMGPRSALLDDRYGVSVTRLGQRIRISGCVELGGKLDQMNQSPLRMLYRILDDWFPGAGLIREAQQWKGARPALPDGPPVVGASGSPGVWLNLGHGDSGWSLSCGSARVLADRIAGREPEVDASRLTVARLR